MKAIFNNKIIAESDKTVEASGYTYFPEDSIKKEYLKTSEQTSVCPMKGTARYFDVIIDGKTDKNAAWHYPTPKAGFEYIKGYISFWKNIEII